MKGAPSQRAIWDAEALTNPEFGKLAALEAALARRGVRLKDDGGNLFMRLYAAMASIPRCCYG